MIASEHDEDRPTDNPADDPSDWEQRRLCPDGGCLGVLGRDGLCVVCGCGDDSGPDRSRLDRHSADEAFADGDDADPDDADPHNEDARADSRSDGDPVADDDAAASWQQRQLCADGACIGIVEKGRCNTCGLSI